MKGRGLKYLARNFAADLAGMGFGSVVFQVRK